MQNNLRRIYIGFFLLVAAPAKLMMAAHIPSNEFDSRILDQGKNVTLAGFRKIHIPEKSWVKLEATASTQMIEFDLSAAVPKDCVLNVDIFNNQDHHVRHARINRGEPHEMYMLSIDEPVVLVLKSAIGHCDLAANDLDLVVESASPLTIAK